MRTPVLDRRAFITGAAAGTAGLAVGLAAAGPPADEFPDLEVVSGGPFDRGREYGRRFTAAVRGFLDREIYSAFVGKPGTKDAMLRYAAACRDAVREYAPEIHAELDGLADGAGLRPEEAVLLSLHEELYHKGVLPATSHCTAVAVGPPETAGGRTYVGQTWDWMTTVYGLSRVLHWKRDAGPGVLAYGFPGLPCGAGLNAAGLALTWTTAGGLTKETPGPRVGVPSYVYLTHLLYQKSLADVVREAGRVPAAGWFTFVMGDGGGNLLNVEGSPKGVVVEEARGRLTRVGYGSRAMTGTPADRPVPMHKRCQNVCRVFDANPKAVDREVLQAAFADPARGVSVGKSTIDMMVFDCTAKEAYLSRGPSYKVGWKRFAF